MRFPLSLVASRLIFTSLSPLAKQYIMQSCCVQDSWRKRRFRWNNYSEREIRIVSPPPRNRESERESASLGAIRSSRDEGVPSPYLRRSAIIARMMGPPSRSEISDVAMVTAAVAILVLSQLSIIGKIRGNPRASRIFYRRQNGDLESPLTPTVLYTTRLHYILFLRAIVI